MGDSSPIGGPPYIGGVVVYESSSDGPCAGLIVGVRDAGDNRCAVIYWDEWGVQNRDPKASYGFDEYEWHWPENPKVKP